MHVWDHGTYVHKIGQVSCLIYVAHILKGQSKLGLEYGQAPSDEKNEGDWIEMLWSCSYVGSLCVSKKKSKLIQIEQSTKGWGRPKITLEKIVKYDMSIKVFFFFRK